MPASLRHSTPLARHVSKAGTLAELMSVVFRALSVHRQRQALLRMDAALLRDIGLTREQALAEARRPIWDAPPNWHN